MGSETEDKQREYYNRIAANYDAHYSTKEALHYRYQVFDNFLKGNDFNGLKVLDAMCGGGENSGFFLAKGADISGVDISSEQCRFYRNRFPAADCRCESILQTSFPDNSFDFIITESLHHLPPQVDKGINEMVRILRPGGRLLIWEPSSGSFLDLIRKIWYRLDNVYFQDNEGSIDFSTLAQEHQNHLQLLQHMYGGNLANLFVLSSMQFRIPTAWVQYYAPLLLPLDRFISRFQGKRSACWILAMFQKKT